MMKIQKKSAISNDKQDRRRGRPAGKNRTPLSLEERRARNAQYERERRNETADAMAQLAEATRCDPHIANAELLATVISALQRRANRKSPEGIDQLRHTNENLESQIALLQSQLGGDIYLSSEEDSNDCEHEELNGPYEPKIQTVQQQKTKFQTRSTKRKRKADFQTSLKETQRTKKMRKTSKSSSVHDLATKSDSDTESDSSFNSNWSASVRTEPTQYRLRNRRQKVSECTTSTYPFRTSESSTQSGTLKLESDVSNKSEASENPVNLSNPSLSAEREPIDEFMEHFDEETETALLETLSEGEKRIINEWLESSETLTVKPSDHVNNQVMSFLDFDDFLLDMNA